MQRKRRFENLTILNSRSGRKLANFAHSAFVYVTPQPLCSVAFRPLFALGFCIYART